MYVVSGIYLLLTILSIGGADVLNGTTSFAARLFDALQNREENFVFSPLSVHTILSLLTQGAAGKTAESLSAALSIPDSLTTATEYQNLMKELNTNENITIEIANKIYVKSGLTLKAGFQAVSKDSFSAEIENIDFSKSKESADIINGWARKHTHGKIDNVVSEDNFDGLTRSVLINAIYFKGLWDIDFDKKYTKRSKFHVSATQTVDCEMMSRRATFHYDDNKELDATLIKLQYRNKRFSMLIGLPNTITGVNELKTKLISAGNTNVLNHLHQIKIDLSLPKFKIETKIDLNGPLAVLGLRRIFSDAAEFPNLIDSKESLFVSSVIQKAFIEVNEEGAEAAAVTTIGMKAQSIPLPPLSVTVDRPFVYSIIAEVNGTNVVLFAGTVVTPEY